MQQSQEELAACLDQLKYQLVTAVRNVSDMHAREFSANFAGNHDYHV